MAPAANSRGIMPGGVGKYLAQVVIVFAAQLAAGKLGNLLQNPSQGGIGPVWPAAGIAVGALLLCGNSVWPGVAAAAFLSAFFSPLPHWAAAIYAAGTTLAALLATLLLGIAKFDLSLSRLRDVLALILFGAFGSSLVSACIGASTLYAAHSRGWSGFGSAWLVYWLGDSTGVLVVMPLVLTLSGLFRIRDRHRLTEFAVLLLLLAATCFVIFSDPPFIQGRLHVLAFAVLPFVLWAALRFGMSATVLIIFLVATIATVGTAFGLGPFATKTPLRDAVLLDGFFAIVAGTGLTLAAVCAEREHAEREREQLIREQAAVGERLRLAAIVESSDDAIISASLDGIIESWNAGAQRIYGFTEAEVLGRPLTILIPPGLQDEKDKILARIRAGERTEHLETIRIAKSGKRVDVSLTLSPVKDSAGAVVGASGIARDISERKRAEEVRSRLAAIVESSNDAIIGLDASGTITNWNTSAERLFGYSAEEAVGKNVAFLSPADRFEEVQRILRKVLAGKAVAHFETVRQKKNGSRIDVSLSVSPIFDTAGRVAGISGIVHDVTERKMAENRLREYEKAVEGLEEMLVVVDRDYRYLIANRKYVDLRHMTKEQIEGHVANEVLNEGVFETEVKEKLDECFQGKIVRFEMKYTYPELGERDVFVSYFPIAGERGIDRVACISQDITERKQAEEALRKSEEKFSKAFRQSPLALTLTSSKDHRYLDVNETFEQLTGWRRDEVIGRTPLDLSLWVDPAQRVEFVNRLVTKGAVRDFEVHYRCKNGTLGVGLGAAELVEVENEPCILSVIADITDRKRTEEALKQSEEKFLKAFRGSPVAITLSRVKDGRFIEVNDTFELLSGYMREEVIGSTVLDIGLWVDPRQREELTKHLLSERSLRDLELRFRTKTGGILTCLVAAELLDVGKEPCILAVASDITQRKLAEEALSKMSGRLIEAQEQERRRIARDLHDDIAQRLALLAVDAEQVQQILPESLPKLRKRVDKLRKQVLEISSSIQTMSHELHSSKLEYLGLVAAVKGFCREFGERQKMEIDFSRREMPAAVPPEISLCLFRVLQEALHNAAKHSGVKRFQVQLWGTSGEAHLAVSDLGRGFDIEAATKGTGLGLTSMRERVRLVNGTIAIESKPMGGTTIHVRVPVQSEQDSQRAAG